MTGGTRAKTRRSAIRLGVGAAALSLILGSCAIRRPAVSALGREFRVDQLPALDAALSNAIAAHRLPGGVLWLERHGVAYRRTSGLRSVEPSVEPMSEDTVFDAASLTKVLATAPAVMQLVERGLIDLEAPAAQYWPEFGARNKGAVTIRQLMTHTSGLPPSLPRLPDWTGWVRGREQIAGQTLANPPGTKFVYSDINFLTLGEIVRRVSGREFDEYCRSEIFLPLGMRDTGFRPIGASNLSAIDRIAPTERQFDGKPLRGVVHDPTARRLGGVAGHAGLFTTAADVARFCRMMLGGGSLGGRRILRPATVALMTHPQSPPGLPARGLGWDIDSPYAGERGDVFPVGGYGHTGWTGGSVWIDPGSATFLILMSNRNHPTEAGNVIALRRELGTLAARAVRDDRLAKAPKP